MPSLAAQEREAVDLFARADRRGPPTSSVVRISFSLSSALVVFLIRLAQRRDALVLAIHLSRSPHVSLKRLAAINIVKFFRAFPDLEEEAINAIYDLCEDQDQNVRSVNLSCSNLSCPTRLFFFRFGSKDIGLLFKYPRNSPHRWRGTWTF
jgi:hypothetical protein